MLCHNELFPAQAIYRTGFLVYTVHITNFFMLVPIGLLQPRPSLHDSNWSDLARYFRKYVYSSWWLTTFIFAGVVWFIISTIFNESLLEMVFNNALKDCTFAIWDIFDMFMLF